VTDATIASLRTTNNAEAQKTQDEKIKTMLNRQSTDPTLPGFMTDCVESYCYSRLLLEELCGAELPPILNVGICGLKSGGLDWKELEYWIRALIKRQGKCYYLEQALVAMLAARSGADIMPANDYITFPSREYASDRQGVLQHYVADSKPWYFGQAWKDVL
jgi:hypothetical protein